MKQKTLIIIIVIVLAIYFLTKKYAGTTCGGGGTTMGSPCNGYQLILQKLNISQNNISAP